jgi:hypothetical protein
MDVNAQSTDRFLSFFLSSPRRIADEPDSSAISRSHARCSTMPGPKPAHRHNHHTNVFRVSSLWCTDLIVETFVRGQTIRAPLQALNTS